MNRILSCQSNATIKKIERLPGGKRFFNIGIKIPGWNNNQLYWFMFVYHNGEFKSSNEWANIILKYAKKQ